MARPNIPGVEKNRVEQIHERHRGYPANSFQEALSTVSDLAEQALDEGEFDVEEFTTSLPPGLAVATNKIVDDHLTDKERYRQIFVTAVDNPVKDTLKFESKETGRLIVEVSVFRPDPPGRRGYRVDISYRSSTGDLERIAVLRDEDAKSVDVTYTDYETKEEKPTTLSGPDTAERVGPEITKFADQAFERWG